MLSQSAGSDTSVRLPSNQQPSVTWTLILCFCWQNRNIRAVRAIAEILEGLSQKACQ